MGRFLAKFPLGAILLLGVAFLVCTVHANTGSETWFKATGPLGAQKRTFLVHLQEQEVSLFKGGHRFAPGPIAGQTYLAKKFVLSAQSNSTDTLFWWHSVLIVRWEAKKTPQLVWQNTVRGSIDGNEWTRVQYLNDKRKIDFHSPFYGDGQHELQEGAIPDEFLPILAVEALKTGEKSEWKVLSPQWEQSYVQKYYRVVLTPTEQTILIDDVKSRLVQITREDNTIAEAWISVDGYRIMKFKTFKGLWLERF